MWKSYEKKYAEKLEKKDMRKDYGKIKCMEKL